MIAVILFLFPGVTQWYGMLVLFAKQKSKTFTNVNTVFGVTESETRIPLSVLCGEIYYSVVDSLASPLFIKGSGFVVYNSSWSHGVIMLVMFNIGMYC
jgi:uncharacterized membrane protein YjjB (DUF3815 family)